MADTGCQSCQASMKVICHPSLSKNDLLNFRHELSPTLQEYYQICDQLYTCDSIILYKDHIVIPPSLWQCVLTVQQSVHQGMTLILHVLKVLCSCHASPRLFLPYGPHVTNATAWHPLNQVPYPIQSYHQYTLPDFVHYKGVNYPVVVDRYFN